MLMYSVPAVYLSMKQINENLGHAGIQLYEGFFNYRKCTMHDWPKYSRYSSKQLNTQFRQWFSPMHDTVVHVPLKAIKNSSDYDRCSIRHFPGPAFSGSAFSASPFFAVLFFSFFVLLYANKRVHKPSFKIFLSLHYTSVR